MIASGVIENAAVELELDAIAEEVIDETKGQPSVPLPQLVGDLLLLLATPQLCIPGGDTLRHYRFMLSEIARGSRWQRLRRRLATQVRSAELQKKRRVALRFLAATMARELATFARSGNDDDVSLTLEEIGEGYNRAAEFARDKSERLADDYALLMAEFARRGFNYHYLAVTLAHELVELCLATHGSEEDYQARQLEIVHLPGDEEERLPGDLFGARGVTIKTREEQWRDILPSEFALWQMGQVGRMATIDKIINRSPLIVEHFSTTRPLSRHRVLVVLIAAAERTPREEAGLGAELRARLAVFHLLFALARKVPRDQVLVDVALFTRMDGRWAGAFFPLETVPPRDQAWRNILELDELQPSFFAAFTGRPHQRRRRVEHSSSAPGEWLARVVPRGAYRGVLIGAFGRAAARREALPPSTLALPPMDGETPLVLLGTVEDEPWHEAPSTAADGTPADFAAARRIARHRQAALLNGAAFSDLLSAHLAPLPLPKATLPQLSAQFLEMVIGPRREGKAGARF